MAEKKLNCVWDMGTPCDGNTELRLIFEDMGGIAIPMCEAHYKEHGDIMFLRENGLDVETILSYDCDQRKQQCDLIRSKQEHK